MNMAGQSPSRTKPVLGLFLLFVLAILVATGDARAAAVWVDPVRGSDEARGTRGNPLRSVTEAWQRLPAVVSEPTRIELKAGNYRGLSPIYWEDHSGRGGAPITIRSVDGRGRARLPAVNLFGVSHLEFRGIQFSDGGDVVHCERCSHFTLRKVIALGRGAQEVVKVNQSDNIQILGSTIVGGGDNGIDLVAIQRARIRNNVVRDSGDWCGYAKGGSVDVVVTGNLFTRCGTGGFSAGQGTGFQFMVRPWLQYEAIGVVIRGNTVTQTEGAAFGIQGGFNVLVAGNVARRVGERSHVLEAVYGLRSCDGQPGDEGRERCQEYLDSGGWGTTAVDDGTNAVRIPNRHAFFIGNVILNPAPYRSEWQQLQVFGPIGPQPGTNVPADAAGDSDLRFTGNVVWNGPADMPLGIGDDGCRPSNPTCNPGLVEDQNRFNRRLPSVRELRNGRLRATGWAAEYATRASEPTPDWSDLPAGTPPWRAWPR
ncbi:MAG: right-handed parallel beta-helix repeat-containing protein [Solirubrobacterales bacterium]|nr:right-handed parallel beta-helix repeat-containing protein [Solirubrobacterales bacterium]